MHAFSAPFFVKTNITIIFVYAWNVKYFLDYLLIILKRLLLQSEILNRSGLKRGNHMESRLPV